MKFHVDEDTIVARYVEPTLIMVIGHCLKLILERTHAKCYAFGGTGVASYINLEGQRRKASVSAMWLHYGDQPSPEHAMALLMGSHVMSRTA